MRTPFSRNKVLSALTSKIEEEIDKVRRGEGSTEKIKQLLDQRTVESDKPNELVVCCDCDETLNLDSDEHVRLHVISAVTHDGVWKYWTGHPLELPICMGCWQKILAEEARQNGD